MKAVTVTGCWILAGVALVHYTAHGAAPVVAPDWPAEWVQAWSDPPASIRPLQIVHGVPPQQATAQAMAALKSLGLGGIVCNVDFSDYLVSDTHWATLTKAVQACRDAGLIVWLYDEKGYPSGSAGGLVLKANREFEALALSYDASREDPFVLRRAYEYTHASNNFCAARRYPNIIDPEAVRAFIDRTHAAYWQRLQEHFGSTIQAVFTDEPSLMATHLGELSESVRQRVPIDDPPDPNVKPLPCVPWVHDLPERYRQRYAEDLIPVRRSLFSGHDQSDRRVRRQFWSLIADLTAERYFGQIQDWCHSHHIASSGHILWEENILAHVPLEGSAIKALRRMDIPGLDMLSSDPQAVIYGGWMSALFPASAAIVEGRRRVMTEVSDFSQTQAGQAPVSLPQMQATAAWHAALGVTEFTLYYDRAKRLAGEYRAYCDYVGRLNALLREAQPDPDIILYYPIYDLWADYLPVAGQLKLDSQPPRVQQLVNSFGRLGQRLLMSQAPFLLADHEVLANASANRGTLHLCDRSFRTLVLPDGVELPEPAAKVVAQFKAGGGRVIISDARSETAPHDWRIETSGIGALQPAADRVVLGRFVRRNRPILLLVNVGTQAYAGSVAVTPGRWSIADPATGQVQPADVSQPPHIPLSLSPHAAVLLVGPAASADQPTTRPR